jgi:CrcB protein
VNLLGGYLIGVAMGYFANNLSLSPEWRLFVITGFLGGLTTFSTLSAEVVSLLQQSKALGALCVVGTHTVGSIVMTFLGLLTYSYVFQR